jgi:amino acid transporter
MNEAPATSAADRADREYLKLLAIFHYIVGGVMIAFSSLAIIYIVLGILMIADPDMLRGTNDKTGPPLFVGYLFAIMGGVFLVVGWTTGGLILYSGRCLQKRKKRMLSLVVGGIACLFMPFGTLLGIATIVLLCRESVKRLYGD